MVLDRTPAELDRVREMPPETVPAVVTADLPYNVTDFTETDVHREFAALRVTNGETFDIELRASQREKQVVKPGQEFRWDVWQRTEDGGLTGPTWMAVDADSDIIADRITLTPWVIHQAHTVRGAAKKFTGGKDLGDILEGLL